MKKNNFIKVVNTLLALVFCLGVFPLPALAQTVNAESSGFTVQAVIPDNQVDRTQTYFDLRMEPGQSQMIQVSVENNSGEDIVLDLSLNTATTNRNGLIEYRLQGEPDVSLPHSFADLAQCDSELSVPANSSRLASIAIQMPQEPYDGAILGGIVFTKRIEETTGTGLAINNRFSYVIGVRLTETDNEIEPDFQLGSVKESLVNYRGAITVGIRNPQPIIIKDAQATASIYRRGQDAPLHTSANNRVDFAPNSVFLFPVEWDGQRMEPGDYRISTSLTHDGRVWTWDENFNISALQAETVNVSAVNLQPNASPRWRYLVLILILLLIVGAAAYYLGRRNRRQPQAGDHE